ncbi:universal stress protein [Natronobacterium texcoconense]|uniref:Nucleotide-binding universal stress protein, UspA family n=1 Tax=Natronobacterium texcoconense TaxID=1095778 RepID=A0A1H1H1R2_NATTX|nr:universal stress protein [Natronobacterium texcoconense]SDR19425.1 Nucleotide-binding universal stress protein, UspA family [Natronobacterium texcoconense]
MTNHVLVPVDESDRSSQALEFACTEYPDADVTAIHVLDPGDFYAATGIEGGAMANYDELRKHHETQAENILEQARREADEYGREIETEQAVGSVSQSIVDYAAEHDVDHIVIGSHGRTGASRILLGSVAETVARRSPVPVTIVR